MALDFTIRMKDEVSAPAKKSADALAKLDAQIKSESATLGKLEAQMRVVQKAGAVDIGLYRQLSGAIADKKNKVAGLTAEMIKSGGAGFKPAAKEAEGLSVALGKIGLTGAVAGAAVIGLAGAVAYLGGKLVTLGVQASEAKGDITRSLELTYGSQEAAEHTYKVVEGITSRIAISQERAMGLADSLTKAGMVNGDRMVASIEAIGKAEAARKGAGQVIEGVITRSTKSRAFSISRDELMSVGLSYKDLAKAIAHNTGKGVAEAELQLRTGGVKLKTGLDALNSVVDQRMGKLAERKFMTVGVQTQRLHDAFGRLFEGADTGPMAKGLKIIADLLDSSSLFGNRMGKFLTKAFDDVSKAIDVVKPYVENFFYGFGLVVLKVYNAMKPLRKSISKLFGGDQKKSADAFGDAMINMATNVGKGFELAAKSLAFIIDSVGAVSKAMDVVEQKSPSAGIAIQAALNPLGLLFRDWGTGPANDNAKKSGENVAAGVASGIRAGTPAVDAAMAAMGDSAVKAFDSKMQIHSPSKVMAKRGDYLDQGVAVGVKRSSAGPADAMAGVGGGIESSIQPSRGGSKGSGAGPINVVFQAGAIVVQGGSPDALDELKDKLTELMADTFQQAALLQGAA